MYLISVGFTCIAL